MIFTPTDRVPKHNNGCGLLPRKAVRGSFKAQNVTFCTYYVCCIFCYYTV